MSPFAAPASVTLTNSSQQNISGLVLLDSESVPRWLTTTCKQSNQHLGGNQTGNHDDGQLYVNLSTFWYLFLAFITAAGLLVSLVSNMIIIYLFTGTPSLRRNPSNIIAVNLSLSDLLYCIQWPSVIYCSLSQSTWLLEIDFVCKTFGFITVTTASASVLTVLAMSVERAIVIKYSIYVKSRYTIRSAWFVVILIWIVSVGSSLPPLFGKFERFTLDPSKTSCTLDYLSGKTNFKIYMLFIFIFYWILPGVIISLCYITIILTFKRSSKSLRQISRNSSELSSRFDQSTSGSSGNYSSLKYNSRLNTTASWSFRCRHHLRDSFKVSKFLRRASTVDLARDISTEETMCEQVCSRSAATDQIPVKVDLVGSRKFTPSKLSLGTNDVCSNSGLINEFNMRHGFESALPSNKSIACGIVPSAPQSLLGWPALKSFTNVTDLDGSSHVAVYSAEKARETQPMVMKIPPIIVEPLVWSTAKHQSLGNSKRNSGCSDISVSSAPNFSKHAKSNHHPVFEPTLASRLKARLHYAASLRRTSSARDRPLENSGTMSAIQKSSTDRFPGKTRLRIARTGMQIRLARMSFYLILLWLISWTPIALLTLINLMVECNLEANGLLVFFANTMTKLGPTFDVFIYGISHPKIKRKFIQIIKRLMFIQRNDRDVNQLTIANTATSYQARIHLHPAQRLKR